MSHYHCITFAPVQGFIEKSRKLRDLNGSSRILSFLAASICQPYQDDRLILPGTIDTMGGVPNQIVIKGDVSESDIRQTFDRAWGAVVKTCQQYLESLLPDTTFDWNREWNLCRSYGWELFYASGEDYDSAKAALARCKQSRNWVGINWTGESSSLSGADAIAWNRMCSYNPTHSIPRAEIDDFYLQLSGRLSSILDVGERLSIPELIKRAILLDPVRELLHENYPELPEINKLKSSFSELNRFAKSPKVNRWTGWFMGDGDRLGSYLTQLRNDAKDRREDPDRAIQEFSQRMLTWSEDLEDRLNEQINGRIVYAGGDDFLGVLFRNENALLQPKECLQFWYRFPEIWRECGQKDLTVSIGFVWAAPQIPQRDVLQHCRLAEKSAKNNGRDRLAIRILFNSGNYLEWCCPWDCLKQILTSCSDWTHFYKDIATLTARRGINSSGHEIAIEIFKIYFGDDAWAQISDRLWDDPDLLRTAILGEKPKSKTAQIERLNDWIVALSKVGWQIFGNWS